MLLRPLVDLYTAMDTVLGPRRAGAWEGWRIRVIRSERMTNLIPLLPSVRIIYCTVLSARPLRDEVPKLMQ
jgi:hypothetical protein